VGKPISELIRYNADRGVIIANKGCSNANDTKNTDDFITRRIDYMRRGNSHYFQREMPSGIVLEIRGQAMPGGGFVSTFSDITAHIEAEKSLQKSNENLEQRVVERTRELNHAKAEAEEANKSKTKFLAAASHDLMQPFNALSLFTSMLNKKVTGTNLEELAGNIRHSLNAAESLLSDLVEISRLDGKSQHIVINTFYVDELLAPLSKEFFLLTEQTNLAFNYVKSSCIIETDQRLLRRVVQNFLSNAINYCPQTHRQGKVLLGVRRNKESVIIEVWDNGPGIEKNKQQSIFKEFERLDETQEQPGLGLGLAISDRIAKLLGLTITVTSTVGKGSCFSITLPRSKLLPIRDASLKAQTIINTSNEFNQLPVLLIDNEALMLKALLSQLNEWGCNVIAVKNENSLQEALVEKDFKPALIISDYHLDDDKNGVDLVQQALTTYRWKAPCIICSADPSEQVREHTSSADFSFMRKPIKALALKKLMRQLLSL
jgi:signal transduction histidine kinase/CheY-like chemotaxis protein